MKYKAFSNLKEKLQESKTIDEQLVAELRVFVDCEVESKTDELFQKFLNEYEEEIRVPYYMKREFLTSARLCIRDNVIKSLERSKYEG